MIPTWVIVVLAMICTARWMIKLSQTQDPRHSGTAFARLFALMVYLAFMFRDPSDETRTIWGRWVVFLFLFDDAFNWVLFPILDFVGAHVFHPIITFILWVKNSWRRK